jgi:hypothetical protein
VPGRGEALGGGRVEPAALVRRDRARERLADQAVPEAVALLRGDQEDAPLDRAVHEAVGLRLGKGEQQGHLRRVALVDQRGEAGEPVALGRAEAGEAALDRAGEVRRQRDRVVRTDGGGQLHRLQRVAAGEPPDRLDGGLGRCPAGDEADQQRGLVPVERAEFATSPSASCACAATATSPQPCAATPATPPGLLPLLGITSP